MVERKPVMIIKAPDFEMPEQKPVMIIKAPDLEMPEQKPVMIVKAPAAKKKDEVPVKKWQDKPRRRKRHTYTDDELKVLKKEFAKNSSPSDTKLAAIGLQLGLDVAIIKSWFANRRQGTRRGKAVKLVIKEEEDDE